MNERSYILHHGGHPHYISDTKMLLLKRSLRFPKETKLMQIIKHLSDPTKLKIYLLLHKVPEVAVSDITIIFGLSQSAVSHALADLKQVGLVECYRCGQLICYSLAKRKHRSRLLRFLGRIL